MTIEQKIKVFGLYPGCDIQVEDFGMSKIETVDFRDGSIGFRDDDDKYYDRNASAIKLVLTPLTKITLEDAVEVAKILRGLCPENAFLSPQGRDHGFPTEHRWVRLAYKAEWIEEEDEKEKTIMNISDDGLSHYGSSHFDRMLTAIEFLRSHYYSVPYMGYDLYYEGVALRR
jgi:hypothetical protein